MALSFSRGKISTFLTRPISSVFLLASFIVIIISVYKEIKISIRIKKET
jgi:TctA family transporter